MTLTTTVYYTKRFIKGPLKGLAVNCELAFPTTGDAFRFARLMRIGTRGHEVTTRNLFEIADCSFQKYAR